MRTDPLFVFGAHRRWRRDVSGATAIEFAMIVPVLLMLYLGSVDLTTGWTVKRKVTHSVSAMSDLVTRLNSATKSDLNGIFDIGDALMVPRASGLKSAKITAIDVDANGKAKVAWSYARNGTADAANSSVTLPSDLSSLKNVSLIKTNASYDYSPPGASKFVGNFKFDSEVYGQTRIGSAVSCTDC